MGMNQGRSRAWGSAVYPYLLGALTLQLLGEPLIGEGQTQDIIRNVLSTLVLIVSVAAVGVHHRAFVITTTLGAAAAAGLWYLIRVEQNFALAAASISARIVFSLLIVALILHSLFREERVTRGAIFGSVSVYLIVGFAFAVFYVFVEGFWPGAFYVDGLHDPDGRIAYTDFVYFSFVVQTTLGFGDMTPVMPAVRAVVALQAIFGVFYVAILIARFVGLYLAERRDRRG